MKAWASFHPYVLPDVIGCPIPVVDHALREAAREFCLRSHAWRETEEFEAPGAINLFDFDTPNGTDLLKVISASVAGDELDVFTSIPSDWSISTPCDGLYHAGEGEYMVFGTPSAGAPIQIVISVRPSVTATGVGNELFASHADDIAAGAKARLLRSPRKEWTDLAQAGIFKAEFESAIHSAANKDFMQASAANRRVKTWG